MHIAQLHLARPAWPIKKRIDIYKMIGNLPFMVATLNKNYRFKRTAYDDLLGHLLLVSAAQPKSLRQYRFV